MKNKAIGIFDSGVGGMTVFSEIAKKLPNEDIIYLGDTKNFPYGTKSKENIIRIANKCVQFLINKDVKMIVIACGTATSQALDNLRENFNIPIIGIIEPTVQDIKQELNVKSNIEHTKTIGVIATEGTIRSNEWEKQLKKVMQNINVINKACPLLAPMAEEGWTENDVAKAAINEYLKVFSNYTLDKLILGCTHYPLYEKIIREKLGNNVDIVNTGTKIAKFLVKYLREHELENSSNNIAKNKIYLTDIECNFIKVAKNISKNLNIAENIEKVVLE